MAYIVLYVVVPLAQTLAYIANHHRAILLYLSLFLSSIFYDAYTRDNQDLSLLGRDKTIIIRVICGILIVINVFVGILNVEDVPVSDNVFYTYFLLVIPLIIAIWDGIDHWRTEYYYMKRTSGR